MAYNYLNTPQNFSQFQTQQMFPQPSGNVYNINNSLEVANVPTGAGVSVALCLPENLMYIKTMQNGSPLFWTYRITPYSTDKEKEKNENQNNTPAPINTENNELLQRINNLEKQMSKINKELGVENNNEQKSV